jgi:hypothetical protein
MDLEFYPKAGVGEALPVKPKTLWRLTATG